MVDEPSNRPGESRLKELRHIVGTALILCGFAASAEVTEQRDYSFDLAAGDRFAVDNVNGSIAIEPGSESVEVRAELSADSQRLLVYPAAIPVTFSEPESA